MCTFSGVYSNHVAIFTDGCKTDEGVGAAAVTPNQTRTASLPKIASIFTSELHTINMSLSIVEGGTSEDYVIFMYSLSTLYSLADTNKNKSKSRRVQQKVHDILNTKQLEFCLIPSLPIIVGNETADHMAKAGYS